MAEKTAISWTDATFNPWWGCQKVSPACDHCYAERDAKRFAAGAVLWGVDAERRTFGDKHWDAPRSWARSPFFQCGACGARGGDKAVGYQRVCKACGSPNIAPARKRVFCASMGDWLDLDAPIDEFVRLLDTIRLTPELDWLLLSKRIGNWRKRVSEALSWCAWADDSAAFFDWTKAWLTGTPPSHVWVGATVVDQAEADRDIPKLLAVPARVRFLSIEPMLGPITLPSVRCDHGSLPARGGDGGVACPDCNGHGDRGAGCLRLHWVICGGESGPHARPMHPDWPRSLRDQCAAAGVPFHFKQHGEWAPSFYMANGGMWVVHDSHRWPVADGEPPGGVWSYRIGKKAAGRLLDGRTHDDFPTL